MQDSLSVITICFNNLHEVIKTCVPVDQQTLPPYEHLIIDGSSNEEIVNWLTKNPQPAYRRWIHERDKGISDAFNKGIVNAKGTITHLLNSGDTYHTNDVIATVMQYFTTDPGLMWTHSQYVQHRGGIDVISGVPFEKEKLWRGMRTTAHPTMFIKKEVYERHGLYSLDYKIAMDYDMLVRMSDEKFSFISKPLIYFSPGGVSNNQFSKGFREVKKIYRQHKGTSIKMAFWQFRQRLLHFFMQTAIGKWWFGRKNKSKRI
jgi:glycosyltransferase involved in cell wall biosynthesis